MQDMKTKNATNCIQSAAKKNNRTKTKSIIQHYTKKKEKKKHTTKHSKQQNLRQITGYGTGQRKNVQSMGVNKHIKALQCVKNKKSKYTQRTNKKKRLSNTVSDGFSYTFFIHCFFF
jgi:uncharacterized membrane protein